MKLLRTLLLGLLLIIVVLLLGGFLVFNDLTRGPLPQIDGELQVAGLQDRVEVKRDDWGVPYIYASNSYDLFFAQGYTQAQDRWWQMEFSRATGDGRLQELTGENADLLRNDVFIRTIGWRRSAERDLVERYDEETLAVLQAFSDGVNAYIRGKSGGDLSLDYSLLGVNGVNIPIRDWTPADTVVWQKIMAWDLSGGMGDISRAENITALGEEMYADFDPEYDFDRMPTIVNRSEIPLTDRSLGESASIETVSMRIPLDVAGNIRPDTRFVFGEGEGIGSNNWVVSGELTESGNPLLANDPHLGVRMPSIWYEIGLFCRPISEECPYNVSGFAFAPSPGVVVGHNDRIAWGVTNVGPDVMDLFQIKLNPENPLQYEWDSQWRDMIVHQETIRMGDSSETITIAVRETHLGPVINDNRIGEDGKPMGFNDENPMVLRWTALDPSQTVKAFLEINRAQNWQEFREALTYFDAPSQNFIYADVEGNIGYQTPGLIPIRPASNTGLVPVEATDDSDIWLGYIPFDLLPRVYNPESGYIHSANEAVVPLEYYDWLREQLGDQYGEDANYIISQDWDTGYRGKRIVELLESGAPFTVEKFRQIQADNKFIPAEEIAPSLEALEFEDTTLSEARDWLLEWDYQMHMDSPQAALFGQFWTALQQQTFGDQLEGGSNSFALIQLLEDAENVWWDDTATADVVETRDDILRRAFEQGYNASVETLGSDRTQWKWGALHTTTFVNNPLGESGISIVEDIFNRGPVPTSGSSGTVNAASWSMGTGDFSVGSASSFRMIAAVGDWEQSVNMHTTGQSSHPYSPYYDNMIDAWRNVTYKPMLFSDEQVNTATENTLILRP
jgi:penicillin G amidase